MPTTQSIDSKMVCSAQAPNKKKHGDWALRATGFKRKTHINNQSGTHAFVIISNYRIALLKHLSIDKIATAEFDHEGDSLSQSFKIMNHCDRKVKLETYSFYVTIFLFVKHKVKSTSYPTNHQITHNEYHGENGGQWMQLWENRVFTTSNNINILPRHLTEAKFDNGSRPQLPVNGVSGKKIKRATGNSSVKKKNVQFVNP